MRRANPRTRLAFVQEAEAAGLDDRAICAVGGFSAAELKAIDDRVAAQIEAAVKFAEESPFPDVRETYTDVYVNY